MENRNPINPTTQMSQLTTPISNTIAWVKIAFALASQGSAQWRFFIEDLRKHIL